MNIQYCSTLPKYPNATLSGLGVTACYLKHAVDPDCQTFVYDPAERFIFEAFDYEGKSLGYLGDRTLTRTVDQARLQTGNFNVLLTDCSHVKWIKKVVLH